jgi:hypothetical protein
MANISEDTLLEILEIFAASEELPSPTALQELAAAAGKSEQAVKEEYTKLYQELTETEDDPWDMLEVPENE